MWDPRMDASNLASHIRLGQSEIGRNVSLDADIYIQTLDFEGDEKKIKKREKKNQETIYIYYSMIQCFKHGS